MCLLVRPRRKKLSALTASSVGRSKAAARLHDPRLRQRPVGAHAQLGQHDAVEQHVGRQRRHRREARAAPAPRRSACCTVAGGVPMVVREDRRRPEARRAPARCDATGPATGDAALAGWLASCRAPARSATRAPRRISASVKGAVVRSTAMSVTVAGGADPELRAPPRRPPTACTGMRRGRAAAQAGRGPHQSARRRDRRRHRLGARPPATGAGGPCGQFLLGHDPAGAVMALRRAASAAATAPSDCPAARRRRGSARRSPPCRFRILTPPRRPSRAAPSGAARRRSAAHPW